MKEEIKKEVKKEALVKGYIVRYAPECPYSTGDGKVGEHIYVWWKNGRKIPKGHIIHHINGESKDNRIENLSCISRSEHTKIHHKRNDEKYNKILNLWKGNLKGSEISKRLNISKQCVYYYLSILKKEGKINKIKKEKKSRKRVEVKNFYFTIINLLKDGKSPSEISEELKISKQKIYYYTRTLRQLGFIEKSSYGKWEVKRSKRKDLEHALNWKDKKIRGHAFIWKVKLERKYDWKLLLEKNKIHYSLVRGYTPRIILKDKKIWLGKETITIYETRSFYGKNALESRKYAVFGLIDILKELQRKMGIRCKYFFKPVREHYGMIKNELARQINDAGEKLIVRDDLDGEWLWVDDSTGMMGELETGGKGFTKDRVKLNMEAQNWYNDHKKLNFEVTPSFVLKAMNGIQQNQLIFDNNMKSHLEILEKLGKAVDKLTKEISRLKE